RRSPARTWRRSTRRSSSGEAPRWLIRRSPSPGRELAALGRAWRTSARGRAAPALPVAITGCALAATRRERARPNRTNSPRRDHRPRPRRDRAVTATGRNGDGLAGTRECPRPSTKPGAVTREIFGINDLGTPERREQPERRDGRDRPPGGRLQRP